MPSLRVRGTDNEMMFVQNGKLVANTTDFKSSEMTIKLEKKQEGYQGEATDRYDEFFSGVDGKAKLHFENSEIFSFIASIIDRAKRRQPGTTINLKTTLNFPNGTKVRVIMQDLYFGNIPITTGGRDQYIEADLDYSCSDWRVL